MDEPIVIRTERLLLRPFEIEDAEDVLAYASDVEWSRFLPMPDPYTIKDAKEFVTKRTLGGRGNRLSFAIEFEGSVVGCIEVGHEVLISVASIHYAIARRCWNKGLTTEAARAVVDWGFEELELAKVYSWADVENVASWRVMEKIGMTLEGTLRSQGVNRGVRQDYHYYGILRSEWESEPGYAGRGMAEG